MAVAADPSAVHGAQRTGTVESWRPDMKGLSVGHAALDPPARLLRRSTPPLPVHLSWATFPGGGLEPVTDLDTLDGLTLSAPRQLGVQPLVPETWEPGRREAVDDDSDDAAERVAGLLRGPISAINPLPPSNARTGLA